MPSPERDFEQQPTAVQRRPGEGASRGDPVFTLIVTSGALSGTKFLLDATQPMRTLIGQSEACGIRLVDAELSRRHAALECVGGALRIMDLGSTNGTYVDAVHVMIADLHGGEVLRLGSTTLRVEAAAPGKAPELPEATSFGRVLGESREMRRLYALCQRLASSNVPVVIEGETGTGKEVLAEALHEASPRAAGPFVVFDCTAVPPTLVEAELFGHERGAFTGAVSARKGVFEQAHGGSLLVDEIGDLEATLQPKLLRAIERNQIRRIGGDRWLQIDVRIICATRRNLDREVEAGRFRDDLFHRLAVARVELPPLRHRLGDVSALAKHFWQELGGDPLRLRPELLRQWEDYAWPGNIRELRNTVARQVALGDLAPEKPLGPTTARAQGAARLSEGIDEVIASGLPYPQARDRVMDEFRQRFVEHVLERSGGDIGRAAASSGIGRRYFEKLRGKTRG
jgi:transcriptional regulator with GAF, ATPase, and Fis domain